MQTLPIQLREMYNHDRHQLPEDRDLDGGITYTDVLSGYYFLVDYFLQSRTNENMLVGLRDAGLLASALNRQIASFGGTSKWTTHFQISGTLFFGLIMNHAFHDGNKRIALLMLLCSLRRNKRWIDCPQADFEKLTVATAASTLPETYPGEFRRFLGSPDAEVEFISDYIRRKTRRLEEDYHSITFRDLKRTLNQHDCDIREPEGNKISVYKLTRPRPLLGFIKRPETWTRLGSIGFPSWTKQVSKSDLNRIRDLTSLTTANGFDSSVFYSGNDPMFRLIRDFEGPLRRLKDK